jgi:hypothetical protein
MTAQAYDLNKFAALLKADRRYTDQVRILEEYSSACSIYQDLEAAAHSLMVLFEYQSDDNFRMNMAQAVFMHAVITYARALISRTDNRRTINVIDKAFTGEQKAMHKAIADLRSTAMAHYHKPIGPFADEWIADKITLIREEGKEIILNDIFKRSNFKKSAAEALTILTEVAMTYVEKERDKRKQAAFQMIMNSSEDVLFQKKLAECSFDPGDFFPGTGWEEGFWAGDAGKYEFFDPKVPGG